MNQVETCTKTGEIYSKRRRNLQKLLIQSQTELSSPVKPTSKSQCDLPQVGRKISNLVMSADPVCQTIYETIRTEENFTDQAETKASGVRDFLT